MEAATITESTTKCKHLEYFANGTYKDGLLERAIDTFKSSGIDFSLLKKYQIRIFNERKDGLKKRLGFTSLNGHELLQVSRLVEFPYFINEKGETDGYYT